MSTRNKIITGIAALALLTQGYFTIKNHYDHKNLAAAMETQRAEESKYRVKVEQSLNSMSNQLSGLKTRIDSLENKVYGEITRTNVPAITDDQVKYQVSPRDPEFRTNVLAGVKKYLQPIADVDYNGARIRVPIDLSFSNGGISNITAEIRENTAIWKFSVEGHSVLYLDKRNEKGEHEGHLSYFGPTVEDDLNYLKQATDPASKERLREIAKRPQSERFSNLKLVDGLLTKAFYAIPSGREYLPVVSVTPFVWDIYSFDAYYGEVVENSPQYRAITAANPGSKILIIGESTNQAKLLSFGFSPSDLKRFPKQTEGGR